MTISTKFGIPFTPNMVDFRNLFSSLKHGDLLSFCSKFNRVVFPLSPHYDIGGKQPELNLSAEWKNGNIINHVTYKVDGRRKLSIFLEEEKLVNFVVVEPQRHDRRCFLQFLELGRGCLFDFDDFVEANKKFFNNAEGKRRPIGQPVSILCNGKLVLTLIS